MSNHSFFALIAFFLFVCLAIYLKPKIECTYTANIDGNKVVCNYGYSSNGSYTLRHCEDGAEYFAVKNVKAACIEVK